MALRTTVETLDDLPEQVRSLYEEQDDGSFALPEDVAAALGGPDGDDDGNDEDDRAESITRLEKTVQKLRGELKDARKKAGKALSDDELEEFQALKVKERELEEEKAKAEGNLDALVEKRVAAERKEYEKRIQELQDTVTSTSKSLDRLTIDSRLSTAAASIPGWVPEATDDLVEYAKRPDREGRHWVRDPDNPERAVLVDAEGDPVYGRGSKPITSDDPTEWFEQLREVKRHWFGRSVGAGGTQQDGKPPKITKPLKDMSDQEVSDLIEEIGLDEYEKLVRSGKAA